MQAKRGSTSSRELCQRRTSSYLLTGDSMCIATAARAKTVKQTSDLSETSRHEVILNSSRSW